MFARKRTQTHANLTCQSGLPDLKIADITQDQHLLVRAREVAFALLDRDPHLRDDAHATLRAYYEHYYAGRGMGLARVG